LDGPAAAAPPGRRRPHRKSACATPRPTGARHRAARRSPRWRAPARRAGSPSRARRRATDPSTRPPSAQARAPARRSTRSGTGSTSPSSPSSTQTLSLLPPNTPHTSRLTPPRRPSDPSQPSRNRRAPPQQNVKGLTSRSTKRAALRLPTSKCPLHDSSDHPMTLVIRLLRTFDFYGLVWPAWDRGTSRSLPLAIAEPRWSGIRVARGSLAYSGRSVRARGASLCGPDAGA
jgi:hypothetical protein